MCISPQMASQLVVSCLSHKIFIIFLRKNINFPHKTQMAGNASQSFFSPKSFVPTHIRAPIQNGSCFTYLLYDYIQLLCMGLLHRIFNKNGKKVFFARCMYVCVCVWKCKKMLYTRYGCEMALYQIIDFCIYACVSYTHTHMYVRDQGYTRLY